MNHQIHISQSHSEVTLANGAGVLRRSFFTVTRQAGTLDSGVTGPFESLVPALREAHRAAKFIRDLGQACSIRFNGQELAV